MPGFSQLSRKIAPAAGFALMLAATPVSALDPVTSIVGKVVSTTLDVRTKAEVANDAEIFSGANKALLEDKRAEWKGVGILVFGQHVVLAGSARNEDTRKRVEQLVARDKRIRSLKNELRVGADTSLVKDTLIEEKINALLTLSKGISSVNMRWKSVAGHVVLMGAAKTDAEAALARSKVRGLDGVRSVASHLRVAGKK